VVLAVLLAKERPLIGDTPGEDLEFLLGMDEMRIIVAVKQIPDTNVEIAIDPQTNSIDPEDLAYIVNPYDKVAVEEALRVRENIGGGKVTLITLGPPRAEKALRNCLAMGADSAIHIWDDIFEGSGAYGTAIILAKAISTLEYDLILCGKQADDDNRGQVGAFIASLLNLTQISNITKLEISVDTKKAIVHRACERGDREIIECTLPALFTVEKSLNEPRYTSFPDSLEAIVKKIIKLDAQSLGINKDKVGIKGAMTRRLDLSLPHPRIKKVFAPDSSLSALDRMKSIISGGITQKSNTKLIEELPEDAAYKVVKFLREREIV